MRLGKSSPEATASRNRLKAKERLSRLATGEILAWADTAGTGVAKALGDYRRQSDPLSLEEALGGAEALCAAVEILYERDPAT